ncbi:MAG: secretion protein HlyD, partial [Alphaproteobacteria bacterium]|nr:secretion protein HlyD [Alphaproteobacteria bacterium]
MTTVPENGVSAAPGSDPALVEESEVRAMTHVFLFLCMALVVGFLAWSWLGRLDIVSTASGEVVPSSQVKSVQHLEGGIISEIL